MLWAELGMMLNSICFASGNAETAVKKQFLILGCFTNTAGILLEFYRHLVVLHRLTNPSDRQVTEEAPSASAGVFPN